MKGNKTVLDFFVILFCLSGIVFSLYLFQQDLFTSLRSLNNTPAGTVTVKYNTVQRRIQDRMVWDRLFNESPVYNGDLIRISRLSGATLNIDQNTIELGENTLIRIQRDEGPLQIDFFSGGINITSAKESGAVLLSIGDRIVEASPGSVFSASSGDDGLVLRITEGSANIARDGKVETASAGTVLAEDAKGNRVVEPFISMIRPAPNARLIKSVNSDNSLSDTRALQVEFAWNKMNMQPQERLRLEVASDRDFSNIIQSANNLNTRVTVPLLTGFWYWRLSMEEGVSNEPGKVLSTGRLNVADAPAPVAISPPAGRSYNMRNETPEIQLRWTEIPDAMYYQLQISSVSDFNVSEMSVDVKGTSYITGNLNAGTWFWRVLPVFSNTDAQKSYSQISNFNISQNKDLLPIALIMPLLDSTFILGENRDILNFSWENEREADEFIFQISNERNLSNPVITRTTRNNYFRYDINERTLAPGKYYWGVSYKDSKGNTSPMSQIRSFITTESLINQKLIFPADRYILDIEQLSELMFSWETNLSLDKRFQISANPDFSRLEINQPVNENKLSGINLSPGDWYWRITAKPDERSFDMPAMARRFTLTDINAPVREQAAREQEERERAEREMIAEREQAERDRLEREQAALLARQTAEREQAERDRLAREQAALLARQAAEREQAERDRLAREQAALLAQQAAAREQAVREQALREQAERDRLAREQQAAQERLAREQAAREQAERERLAREQQAVTQQSAAQQVAAQQSAAQQAEKIAREQAAREYTNTVRLVLLTPESGIIIPGLTALRQPIVFRWDTAEEIASSRFILSRNANPAARPYVVEMNPERTITLNRLSAGVWYWTVEAHTPEGKLIAPIEPRQIRVLSIPLLPAPENRSPADNDIINTQYLRNDRSIIFRWSQVEGANSYILTLYRNAIPGRREIFKTGPLTELSYTFKDLSLLENSGNFSWQVEALFLNEEGKVEQRGQSGENIFILDIPRPGRIRARDTGVLYGTE